MDFWGWTRRPAALRLFPPPRQSCRQARILRLLPPLTGFWKFSTKPSRPVREPKMQPGLIGLLNTSREAYRRTRWHLGLFDSARLPAFTVVARKQGKMVRGAFSGSAFRLRDRGTGPEAVFAPF